MKIKHYTPSLHWHCGLPISLLTLLWAAHLKHPIMANLRAIETPALLAICLCGLAYTGHKWRNSRNRVASGLSLLTFLVALSTATAQLVIFHWQRQEVLAASAAMRTLGAHFLIGFRDFESLAPLAERGLIGGIYLTRRNIYGKTVEEVRHEIDKLQNIRSANGLPPLIVAADQEGGTVNHLSPLLPAIPALGELAKPGLDHRSRAAFEYGRFQGKGLRALGVNLNLSPVVDLKPRDHFWGDTHTLINQRGISSDATLVEDIAGAYSRGLQAEGVQPTLKHFPGLGRVRADTHHVKAELKVSVDQLQTADWRPFRRISNETGAAIMLAHVHIKALDAKNPASQSATVIQELIRTKWGYDGLILSDDLNMGAVYRQGIANAAIASLNAGVDLLLVTYDHDQFYRALHGAAQALNSGKIDRAMLRF